jgi:hypothetical protein
MAGQRASPQGAFLPGGDGLEDSRHRLEAPGRPSSRPVLPLVEVGGDLAHSFAFVAQPPDLGERGLLCGVRFQMLAIGRQSGTEWNVTSPFAAIALVV